MISFKSVVDLMSVSLLIIKMIAYLTVFIINIKLDRIRWI